MWSLFKWDMVVLSVNLSWLHSAFGLLLAIAYTCTVCYNHGSENQIGPTSSTELTGNRSSSRSENHPQLNKPEEGSGISSLAPPLPPHPAAIAATALRAATTTASCFVTELASSLVVAELASSLVVAELASSLVVAAGKTLFVFGYSLSPPRCF
ncbi:hypothetical protein AHAS_Ahas17G0140000 [Arachis hypogaea]